MYTFKFNLITLKKIYHVPFKLKSKNYWQIRKIPRRFNFDWTFTLTSTQFFFVEFIFLKKTPKVFWIVTQFPRPNKSCHNDGSGRHLHVKATTMGRIEAHMQDYSLGKRIVRCLFGPRAPMASNLATPALATYDSCPIMYDLIWQRVQYWNLTSEHVKVCLSLFASYEPTNIF